MTLKVLAIGDLHYKKNNLAETQELTKKIWETVEQISPHLVVFLGDSLDTFEKIQLAPQKRVVQLFAGVRERLIKQEPPGTLVLLIGNHDRPSPDGYDTDDHPFGALKLWSNTIVVETPFFQSYQDVPLGFIPYLPPGKFLSTLENSGPWKKAAAIFSHQELTGVVYNGKTSQVEKWPLEAPLLINGHIHMHQKINSNFLCVGAPIQHEYEDDANRFFVLLSFDSQKKPQYELIPVEVTSKARYNLHIEELESFVCPPGQIKIVISGPRGTGKIFRKHPKIIQWRSQGVLVRFLELKTENSKLNSSNLVGNSELKLAPNKPYLDRLRKLIQHDSSYVELYEQIFNISVNKKTPVIRRVVN